MFSICLWVFLSISEYVCAAAMLRGCVSIRMITFKPLDLLTSFFACTYISAISRSNSYMKVIGQRSMSWQQKNLHFSNLLPLFLIHSDISHYLYIWQVKLSIVKVKGQGQMWRSRSNKQNFVFWHCITLFSKQVSFHEPNSGLKWVFSGSKVKCEGQGQMNTKLYFDTIYHVSNNEYSRVKWGHGQMWRSRSNMKVKVKCSKSTCTAAVGTLLNSKGVLVTIITDCV